MNLDQQKFLMDLQEEFKEAFKQHLYETQPRTTTLQKIDDLASDAGLALLRAGWKTIAKFDGRTMEIKK